MSYHPTVDLFLSKLWVVVVDQLATMNQVVQAAMLKDYLL
jgi:hypothetical protein